MKENLENYLKRLESAGLLRKERIGIDQVRALLMSASKNIFASEKNLSIDEEACYTLAYNAMLKAARALVFLQGYRPHDGQQHKTTIEVAGEILGKEFGELIGLFDKIEEEEKSVYLRPNAALELDGS